MGANVRRTMGNVGQTSGNLGRTGGSKGLTGGNKGWMPGNKGQMGGGQVDERTDRRVDWRTSGQGRTVSDGFSKG